jgi:hypothetical protein
MLSDVHRDQTSLLHLFQSFFLTINDKARYTVPMLACDKFYILDVIK